VATTPTYYTTASAPFFPGAVALLNSLRLCGNDGELVVVDAGLTREQRRALVAHADVVAAPAAVRENPSLAKPFPYVLGKSGVAVVIDSDMIVTADLAPFLRTAAAGKICLFPDHESTRGRWFAEWERGLDLRARPRRQTYLNTGFVALDRGRWNDVLGRWWHGCELVSASGAASGTADTPFWARDQDVLNAILMSEVPADAVAALPAEAEVYWDRLREVEVLDEARLTCHLAGAPVAILHYSYRPKPWEPRAWPRVTDDAFMRLLPRVLFEPDVPLRLEPRAFPLWARPGRAGRVAVRVLDAAHFAAKAIVYAPPAPARRRLVAARNSLFDRAGR
jgi:hypothetical protein